MKITCEILPTHNTMNATASAAKNAVQAIRSLRNRLPLELGLVSFIGCDEAALRAVNPNGIQSFSPGLVAAATYPGSRVVDALAHPERVASVPGCNPFRVGALALDPCTQGRSPSRPTLG